MAQNTATTDGGEAQRETTRFSEDVSLADVIEGDRIDPQLIPRSPEIAVGEAVSRHLARQPDADDDRTFSVRLIAGGSDRYNDVQDALVYDPEADLFARLSGHTNSGAMNQTERDWKVRDVGRGLTVVDCWDVEIPDLPADETPAEYVAEWVEIMADGWRHGDDYHDLETFDGKKFRLRDHDGRTARIQYELVAEE